MAGKIKEAAAQKDLQVQAALHEMEAAIAAAAQEIVDDCIEKHILEDYFRTRRSEVISMLTAEMRAQQELEDYLNAVRNQAQATILEKEKKIKKQMERQMAEKDLEVQAALQEKEAAVAAAVQEKEAAVQKVRALKQIVRLALQSFREGKLSEADLDRLLD